MATARPHSTNQQICCLDLGCKFDDVKYWQEMDPKAPAMLYVVYPLSEEWNEVAGRFHSSLNAPEFTIVRIHRVQNPMLWAYFVLKRRQMAQDLKGLDPDEKRLFHGTYRDNLEAIVRRGFDVRIGQKHGKMYGEGTYFTREARYAHSFTDCGGDRISSRWKNGPPAWTPLFIPYPSPEVLLMQQPPADPDPPLSGPASPSANSECQMPCVFPPLFQIGTSDVGHVFNRLAHPRSHFVISSRVLVGRYTQGHPDLRRPPPCDARDPHVKLYDSCVDDIFSPKTFVIFDHNQTYPEHIIEYTWTKGAQF